VLLIALTLFTLNYFTKRGYVKFIPTKQALERAGRTTCMVIMA